MIVSFATHKELHEYAKQKQKEKDNDKVYAKNHIDEKKKIIFHGGCLGCVTPLHYGLGNCLECMYFEPNWNKRDLSIIDYSK